ncbi:hypothetical protein HY635_00090, partial [Candidatus Uhrbacteria bacterium]|nr:hypothetical protein [Candidatus Uhrbacteria bacterium]
MRIDIVTIFPEAITPYLNASILKRAQEKRRVRIGVHDLKQWGMGKRRTLDDKPYGGGPGMVMMVEPFFGALRALGGIKEYRSKGGKETKGSTPLHLYTSTPGTRVLLASAKGKLFTQRDAERYAKKYDRLVILAGHYEGVDERVATYLADEEVSIGPYVLTGGELPALIIADAIVRLIPGVLGNAESPKEESFSYSVGAALRGRPRGRRRSPSPTLEHPQFTRPA